MQAIASSTSDRMPIDVRRQQLLGHSGGIRKPVALVRIVNSRKIAVRPGMRLEPSIPNITIMPATIPIRLMIDMHQNERRQTHTQYHDALPPLETF